MPPFSAIPTDHTDTTAPTTAPKSLSPSCRQRKFAAVAQLIGNTPLIGLQMRYRGQDIEIFAKAETYNLSGSIKDRMALHVLRRACETGALQPGDTIVEATSGNAGIAFAAIGCALGHEVKIYMPNWMSPNEKSLIRSYGAQVIDVSKEQGGFLGAIALAEQAGQKPHAFLPRQFANQDNCNAHCLTTGPEILDQLHQIGLSPDAFVAGVGTGGTVMGVGACLREHLPKVAIHPLEPTESPTLSTGHKVGHHRMQGISDEFIPAIVKLDQLDEIISVNDGDAILMAQKLSREFGLGVGISSGGNIIGALKLIDKYGPQACIVTILCDDNKKYLSTDLVKDEAVKPSYLTPEVELLEFRTC